MPALQELLHDKRFLYAGGVVAAVGAYALYARKRATGSSAASTVTGTPAYSTAGLAGAVDTTGSDVANWLGNYSGSLQNQLDQYQQQLTGAVAGLQAIGTGPNPAPPFAYYQIEPGDSFLSIAQKFASNGLSYDYLRSINPEVAGAPALTSGGYVRLRPEPAR